MIKTVKETIASIKDVNYGQVIITKTTRQVLWYWSKYLILISVIPLIVGIFAFTRYLPESPKFIQDTFPAGKLTVKNHQLATTIKEPYRVGNQDFALIIDTKGDPKELNSLTSGILLLKDKAVIKSQDNQIDTQDYSKIPDFSTDKNQLSSWVSQHSLNLWLGGFGVILVIGLIAFALSWILRAGAYGLWAVVFWLLGKYLLKKTLTYFQSFSLVLYASVVQLILSLFLTVAPNQLLEALGTVLFVFFAFTWLRNMPGPNFPVVVSSPAALPVARTLRKSRKNNK